MPLDFQMHLRPIDPSIIFIDSVLPFMEIYSRIIQTIVLNQSQLKKKNRVNSIMNDLTDEL